MPGDFDRLPSDESAEAAARAAMGDLESRLDEDRIRGEEESLTERIDKVRTSEASTGMTSVSSIDPRNYTVALRDGTIYTISECAAWQIEPPFTVFYGANKVLQAIHNDLIESFQQADEDDDD